MNPLQQGAIGEAMQVPQAAAANVPDAMRAEYEQLIRIYGPEVAAMMMQQKQQQAGRASVGSAVQSFNRLGNVADPRAQFAQMASLSQA